MEGVGAEAHRVSGCAMELRWHVQWPTCLWDKVVRAPRPLVDDLPPWIVASGEGQRQRMTACCEEASRSPKPRCSRIAL